MTYGFHRSRRGIVADLGEHEREILIGLLQQTAMVLTDGAGAASDTTASDPAAPDDDSFEAMMRRAGFEAASGDSDGRSETSESSGETGGPAEIEDSAMRRLLPDAHADAETAAEFRRLTGTPVRDRKLGHLRTAVQVVAGAKGGRLRLTEAEATSLLIAMTDVRLVLADRLDLDTDDKAESLSSEVATMDRDDPRFALALGYEFLTWLQETLAVALTP